MFPDAVTARGRKHILKAAMHRQGIHTGVHWDRARWFLPDYHTDPDFASAFMEASPDLDWKALALSWTRPYGTVTGTTSFLSEDVLREHHDCGDYLFVMHLKETKTLSSGPEAACIFQPDIITGSARNILQPGWPVISGAARTCTGISDYIRASMPLRPFIRTTQDLEHDLAYGDSIAGWRIEGCTDCDCASHLFSFQKIPSICLPSFRLSKICR